MMLTTTSSQTIKIRWRKNFYYSCVLAVLPIILPFSISLADNWGNCRKANCRYVIFPFSTTDWLTEKCNGLSLSLSFFSFRLWERFEAKNSRWSLKGWKRHEEDEKSNFASSSTKLALFLLPALLCLARSFFFYLGFAWELQFSALLLRRRRKSRGKMIDRLQKRRFIRQKLFFAVIAFCFRKTRSQMRHISHSLTLIAIVSRNHAQSHF